MRRCRRCRVLSYARAARPASTAPARRWRPAQRALSGFRRVAASLLLRDVIVGDLVRAQAPMRSRFWVVASTLAPLWISVQTFASRASSAPSFARGGASLRPVHGRKPAWRHCRHAPTFRLPRPPCWAGMRPARAANVRLRLVGRVLPAIHVAPGNRNMRRNGSCRGASDSRDEHAGRCNPASRPRRGRRVPTSLAGQPDC